MPNFTINDNLNLRLDPESEKKPKREQISKQMVLDMGLHFLHKIGTEQICRVCIDAGGSCCGSCRHLADGIGCQLRNTSCTAWLCGFLKYVLFEIDLLQNWNDFWKQIPGQDYREDFTPDKLLIRNKLAAPNFRMLGQALAADLQELEQSQISVGYIITLREKIDKNMDRIAYYKHDPQKRAATICNIQVLSAPFHRFHKASAEYREQHS
ncbi:hypothetical protein [Paenibacillus sp. BC26]|uniref:hypothetical protein n=1 Tax=Paenibacillus sp. BC26 TaxID=1881032 RepID=UPI0008F45629|nr:hypothetical protein [Paenibacillus sp. BC26]SFS61367.1 hypothetical protein SAMN05428962_1459 [Paenibacillus sp. BC26]